MRFSSWVSAAALLACFSVPAAATTVQGVVTRLPNASGAYAAALTDIHAVSGRAVLPDDAYIVCIDPFHSFPTFGSTQSFVVYDTVGPVMEHAGGSARATDFIHYVVDKYFDAAIPQGRAGGTTGTQFNQALWELTADFDGTLASLSSSAGTIFSSSGTLYRSIISDLRTNFSLIATGYRSTQYQMAFLDAVDPRYQSMVMFSPLLQEVPEPATLPLLVAGGLAVAALHARRRRAGRTQAAGAA